MSAQLEETPRPRPMQAEDLDAIMAIERMVYPFPWTRGNFKDSLSAGYSCWVYEYAGAVMGYGVIMLAGGESHLLNLSIASEWQGQGYGRKLLEHFIRLAKEHYAKVLFLEVRPSNRRAIKLYERAGFNEIAVRRHYYPAAVGREDAIVMGLPL